MKSLSDLSFRLEYTIRGGLVSKGRIELWPRLLMRQFHHTMQQGGNLKETLQLEAYRVWK